MLFVAPCSAGLLSLFLLFNIVNCVADEMGLMCSNIHFSCRVKVKLNLFPGLPMRVVSFYISLDPSYFVYFKHGNKTKSELPVNEGDAGYFLTSG